MGLSRVIGRILKKEKPEPHQQKQATKQENPLSHDLQDNLHKIRQACGKSPDLMIREFNLSQYANLRIALIYFDGLADAKSINNFIMEPLMAGSRNDKLNPEIDPDLDVLQRLNQFFLPVGEISDTVNIDNLMLSIISGETAILADGYNRGLLIGLKGWEDRGVQEPTTQTVIRGPKEGFSENIGTNIALVRRKIKSPHLWLESYQIGAVTKTNVSMMYLQGTANEEVVNEVRDRLKRIRIDGILESGNIEELVQDKTFTPFPTLFNSERPDVVASGLLEGRVAILIDGTPFALLVPALFTQFFQAAEDHYVRADIASLLRILRFIAFFITLLAPSLYIAITTYHHEMVPPPLLISLIAQRQGVPFPAFVEALLMEVIFELLREAGVRLPRAVGQSISIVGALVIGQSAVEAGMISAVMVIVVSITAISSFAIPAYDLANTARMLRFALMGLAAAFGLYGIIVGLILMVQNMCSLNSFGVPYMSPLSPVTLADQKDTFIRVPRWGMFKRPRFLAPQNPDREDQPSQN